jgi:hypothetical protein
MEGGREKRGLGKKENLVLGIVIDVLSVGYVMILYVYRV